MAAGVQEAPRRVEALPLHLLHSRSHHRTRRGAEWQLPGTAGEGSPQAGPPEDYLVLGAQAAAAEGLRGAGRQMCAHLGGGVITQPALRRGFKGAGRGERAPGGQRTGVPCPLPCGHVSWAPSSQTPLASCPDGSDVAAMGRGRGGVWRGRQACLRGLSGPPHCPPHPGEAGGRRGVPPQGAFANLDQPLSPQHRAGTCPVHRGPGARPVGPASCKPGGRFSRCNRVQAPRGGSPQATGQPPAF